MDNLDNKINHNLEDKAWASMRDILDKEMPEVVAPTLSDLDEKKKKKRRFLFIFLFLFGLIGSGLGYYIYAQNIDLNKRQNELKNNIASINKSEKNSPINDVISLKNSLNIEPNNTPKAVNTEGGNLDKNKLDNSLNKAKVNDIVNTKNIKQKSKNHKSQNVDNQLITTGNDIVSNYQNNIQNKSEVELNKLNNGLENNTNLHLKNNINSPNLAVNDAKIIKENNIVIEQKNDEKEEPYIAAIKSISATDLIDILEPKPIYFDAQNELNKDYNALKKISIINPKKWSYGLVLGLNTEGSPKMLTGFGGLYFERKISAKWSINTGLNYRVLAKNVSNVEYLQNADSLNSKSTSAGLYTTNSGLLRVNRAYLKNLSYIEIPIQVNYHLNSKISFYGGAKIAYLVTQNVRTNDVDPPVFLTTQASLDVARVIAESKYSSNDLGLNKWDLGLLGGVNYNFSNRFSMQLRYDVGLIDIYKGGDAFVFNRFFGLSAAYRF